MSLSTELGARVAALDFDDCPAEAIRWAKIAVLDTLGVSLAGSTEEAPKLVGDALGIRNRSGPSSIFGSSQRVDPLDAAQVNGTASHALDFDDSSDTLFGHPSGPMFSALIALAEDIGAGGRELLVAYVAGFETTMRLARLATLQHYDRGWHSTSTLGIFGVAAACARLMRLGEQQTATALALSASLSSGIKANFGSMAKPFHVGQCARNGLLAALLARSGFTAKLTSLEDREGFFAVFNGSQEIDFSGALTDWGEAWDIVEPGIATKQYPCCGSTHASIDGVLDLAAEYKLEPQNVARIETLTNARSFGHTNRPRPQSSLDAKFSIQYCVARALVDGRVTLEHFDDGAYSDPVITDVMNRVLSLAREDPMSSSELDLSADVAIETIDGARYSKRVIRPLGRGPQHPLPAELLKAKFNACASRVLSPPAVERLYERIQDLEGVARIAELTELMAPVAEVNYAHRKERT